MKKFLILLAACFCYLYAYPQRQGNIWYFGYKVGIDFNSGKPVEIKNSQMDAYEGCGSISDRNGHILFYTEGINVWNRNHTTMPNGTNLAGNVSSTQSGVIVPLPGDTSIYYIFTVDFQGHGNGIEYSTIDMSADKGNGDVTSKNNFLYAPACEKITAVPVSDGSGYWIITHQYGSDTFVTFKLTSKGLTGSPVKSQVGPFVSTNNDNNTIGYLVISPDSKKLAMANSLLNDVELFDFDNTSGIVSNAIKLNSNGNDYGACFSPDSKRLYITQIMINTGSKSHVQQYDITASDIPGSMYSITTNDSGVYGAIQLGPDGKIYLVRPGKKYLDVIQNPNNKGSACNYTFGGVNLKNGFIYYGLPNIPPFTYSKAIITYTSRCYPDTFHFYSGYAFNKDSTYWIIKQPNGNKQKFKNKDTINRVLKDTGVYTIYFQIYYKKNLSVDSVAIHVLPTPDINLGNDTLLCSTSPFTLNAPTGYTTYTWQNGSHTQSFDVQKTGKYWLKAQTGSCIKSDTINVAQANVLINKLKALDTLVCPGFSFSKDISQAGCKYLWNDGDTSGIRKFTKGDLYSVKVSNQCGYTMDTFNIKVDNPLKFNRWKDTTICKESGLTLYTPDSLPGIWQNGALANKIKVTNEGKYKFTIVRKCETIQDSINVSFYPEIKPLRKIDTVVCSGNVIHCDYTVTGANYLWNDGYSKAVRSINTSGLYVCKISNKCYTVEDTVLLKIQQPLKFDLGKDTILCIGKTTVLSGPDSAYYLWQDGSKTQSITIDKSGMYKLKATNTCGSFTDSIAVNFNSLLTPMPVLDTIICISSVATFDKTQKDAKYIWENGSKLPKRTISLQGVYWINTYNGCSSITDTIKVKNEHPLVFSLGNDTMICPGQRITLHARDSVLYQWQDSSKAKDYIVSKAGYYVLIEMNTCGKFSDSIKISYTPPYFSTLPKDTTLCEGDSFQVNAYSIPGEYSWNNGVKGSKIILKQAGLHILTFKNQCQTVTDTININTDSFCHCYLYTPDIFSPDNNGINDTWKPSSCSRYKSYLLQVYDRWGERVFTSNKLNEGWDGNFKGKEVMEGMYLFIIRLTDVHNESAYKSGRFYLIRH